MLSPPSRWCSQQRCAGRALPRGRLTAGATAAAVAAAPPIQTSGVGVGDGGGAGAAGRRGGGARGVGRGGGRHPLSPSVGRYRSAAAAARASTAAAGLASQRGTAARGRHGAAAKGRSRRTGRGRTRFRQCGVRGTTPRPVAGTRRGPSWPPTHPRYASPPPSLARWASRPAPPRSKDRPDPAVAPCWLPPPPVAAATSRSLHATRRHQRLGRPQR